MDGGEVVKGNRFAWIVAGLFTLLLAVACLDRGLPFDDLVLVARVKALRGLSQPLPAFLDGVDAWGHFSAYQFTPRTPELLAEAIETGYFPWWTHPELRIAFWRPLSTATFLLDGALWPNEPLLWHLHSVLWYVAFLGLVALLLRRLSPRLAPLAFLLFAVDEGRFMPAYWVSNRHALVSGVFALAAMLAYLRAREGWKAGELLAPFSLGLALLGGESAVGALPWLLAFEGLERKPGVLRRLGPIAAVAATWAVVYATTRSGARHSGAYLDPLGEPLAWASRAVRAVPILLGSLVNGVSATLVLVDPVFYRVLPGLGVVALLAALVWGRGSSVLPSWRWLALPMVLCVLPASAAVPADRNLAFASLAAVLFVADWLTRAWAARRYVVVLALGFFHVVVPVLSNGLQAASLRRAGQAQEQIARTVERWVAEGRHDFLFVQGSDGLAFYARYFFLERGGGPSHWWLGALGKGNRSITRQADGSFLVEAADHDLVNGVFPPVVRDRMPAVGEVVRLEGLTVTVEARGPEGPTRLRLAPEGPVQLVGWGPEGLTLLETPPVGQPLYLPWYAGPTEAL